VREAWEGKVPPEAKTGWRTDRGGGVYRSKGQLAKVFREEATPAEARFWELVRSGRLDELKFRRQHQIGNFIVDFCCLQERLVVELIGSAHDHAEAQAYDAKRRAFLHEVGFRVLEFDNEEVLGDPRACEAKLRAFIATPRSSSPSHTAAPFPQGEADLAAAVALPPSQERSHTNTPTPSKPS
jgi:type I restriction enzyme R subunit